jgi:hypothetical protein
MLEKEYEFYIKNKDKFLKKYKNKFLVIIGEKICGVFDTKEEALAKTAREYELGTFLLQQVTDNDSETIQRYNSRVYV